MQLVFGGFGEMGEGAAQQGQYFVKSSFGQPGNPTV